MNKQLIAQLALIFIVTQAVGLYAGNYLVDEQLGTTIVNEDPDSVDNSIGLIGIIMASTLAIILILRFGPDWVIIVILKAIESLALFVTALIVLMPTGMADEVILVFAAALIIGRLILSKNILLRNISSMIAAAGAGSLIGASLGVIPLIVFMVLLGIYDFIAVFKTKHMVELADGITKNNLAFTFAMPTKEHKFELGTGDIVVPLAFAVSVLASAKEALIPAPYFLIPPIAVLIASFSGILITLFFVSGKKAKPMPAIPIQAGLMIVAFVLIKLAGY